ncbi:TIP41-like family protein [Galdieria sulphuraria]|uniref:TIP41-like family protein n=1 Tax=Galdieria sulphuraria TaxID=130081 RepID=M2Y7X4_GALSU|nr:TIP41-like family protein [Galdieria sulphuraria]EME32178.1 TIP41-like family protein [Galdieria sulphuraria]|eukprot:XP_005708698.1 TIP41-like family protein [Galdieria sulphuraria]
MTLASHEVHQTPPYYLYSEGKGIEIDKWSIEVTEGPILSSNEVESWQSRLSLKLPTMVFGRNTLSFLWNGECKFYFSAFDGLQTVSHESPSLRVKPAVFWEDKQSTLDSPHANYDWTYSTNYGGTWLMQGEETALSASQSLLDWSLLRREDIPLLFFKELPLYEDELDDQGVSSLSVRLVGFTTFHYIVLNWLFRE